MTGTITTNAKGFGRIVPLGEEAATIPYRITVLPEFVHTALPGDIVEFEFEAGGPQPDKRNPKIMERLAQVKKVIERARTQYVGYTTTMKGTLIFAADDRRIYTPFLFEESSVADLRENKKVLVEITSWKNPNKAPLCKVIRVLGDKGDHETEIGSILLDRGIQAVFPQQVEKDAAQVAADERTIKPEERALRRDFTGTVTFTIDPHDAKDFDDAISLKKLSDTRYEVGIHIADVSHYVRPGTALDDEALKRATSIYLVDRVIPMLPEVLSNDLCSLNPYEERRAYSAVFEMDSAGTIYSRWFGKSIIVSNRRFTYEEAQEVIETGSGDYAEEIRVLSTITREIRKKKFEHGAIDFDTEEVKFVLDAHGKPIKVIKKLRFEAHKLIEDLMLLANKEVAFYISSNHKKLGSFGMYRIHESPTKEKLADLLLLYKALGYDIDTTLALEDPRAIQAVLKKIDGKPGASLLKTATIRAMSKAIYATENIGHYGLAFEYYTHFTSPIRRYPDLEVHRLLTAILAGKAAQEKSDRSRLIRIAEHSTMQEIGAADAERASIKMKQVEYMSERIGKEFEGVISGITEWGLYVEDKETKSEGMARLRDLTDDLYIVEERLMRAVGKNTKKTFSLGDKVIYRVVSANIEERTLDYAIVRKLD